MKRILVIIEYFYTSIYLRYAFDKYFPDYKIKKFNLVTNVQNTEHTVAITININALFLECLFLNSHTGIQHNHQWRESSSSTEKYRMVSAREIEIIWLLSQGYSLRCY